MTVRHSGQPSRLTADAYALENARPTDGPCYRVSSDVAVRFADTPGKQADHRLNVRHPDIIVRDCDPYEVNTARDHIHLVAEVASETTFDTDTAVKRALYASAGIPGYSSSILTRTGRRSAKSRSTVSTGQDAATSPAPSTTVPHPRPSFSLTVTFDDLQRP